MARQLLDGDPIQMLPKLADALAEAGCSDSKLLEYCREKQSSGDAGKWVWARRIGRVTPFPIPLRTCKLAAALERK